MRKKPQQELAKEAREALLGHAIDIGLEARQRYGEIDYPTLLSLLEDKKVVRFPVRIEFDASELQPGEFAWAAPLGDHPKDGYCLYVHPRFEHRERDLPLLIAYHLVCVNYGDVATREAAEAFGAALFGLAPDDYYRRVCALADELGDET